MEAYKASELAGIVLADWRQTRFMNSHRCCLFEESLESAMLKMPSLSLEVILLVIQDRDREPLNS